MVETSKISLNAPASILRRRSSLCMSLASFTRSLWVTTKSAHRRSGAGKISHAMRSLSFQACVLCGAPQKDVSRL